MNWRLKKQFVIVVTILIVAAMIGGWFVFKSYFTPTCFDNKKDGGETDVDCGGPCTSCEVTHAEPIAIFWARGVAVRENTYDVVAYIENRNEVVSSSRVEYEFVLSDDTGEISRRTGTEFLFPQERTYIVETGLEAMRVPTRVDFRITRADWVLSSKTRPDLVVEKREYAVRDNNGRRQSIINSSIYNRAPFDFRDGEVLFVVFDQSGMVIGVSKVIVEDLQSGGHKEVSSVWPGEFSGKPDVILVSIRVNIFDPLTTKSP